ncbi:MAG: ABC transporter permease [bacterium]
MGAVLSYPLRSFFCLFGISLGIVSITLIVASTDGANYKANQMLSDFGPDSMIIFGGHEQQRAARLRLNTITLQDMAEIKNSIAGCYETIPMVAVRNTLVSYENKKWQTLVIGSTVNYFTSWGWRIAMGSAFTEKESFNYENVAVLGADIVEKLFDGNSAIAIGKTILIKNKPVRVIGVLKERGTGFGSFRLDDRIIMPIDTVMRKYLKEDKYISAVRARFHGNLEEKMRDVKSLLRKRHNLKGEMPDDFTIRTAEDAKKFLLVLQGTLVLFLGIAGGVALVVGGFVMANLFMISVQERRKEIGIRRAFGAKRGHIILQFLLEAFLLSLAGTLLGLFLGFLIGKILSFYTTIPIMFSYKIFWLSSLTATIVGIIAGLVPAKRAASLDPVEAIRT